jgi:hypothetical protein
MPSFGLYRFDKGLHFVPPDDEGFILRGDKRRLLYKGRRRSHRFTILCDTAFEYDCILEREPESNVISLRMEGAENFDCEAFGLIPRSLLRKTGGAGDLFPRVRKDFKEKFSIPRSLLLGALFF